VCTRVSRYQKGKTNVDFTKAIDSDWQWQLASAGQYANLHHPRQITMPGHMPFLPPNQQHQRLNIHHTKLKISECLDDYSHENVNSGHQDRQKPCLATHHLYLYYRQIYSLSLSEGSIYKYTNFMNIKTVLKCDE